MSIPQVMYRLFLWFLSLFVLGVLLLILGTSILFWRLSEGRMSMAEVSKGISSALSMPEREIFIDVQSARLTWSDWESPLAVILYQTELRTPGGNLLLPEMEVGLDPLELIRAELVPLVIRLEKPKLRWNPRHIGFPVFAVGGLKNFENQEKDFLLPEQFQKLQKVILNDAQIEIFNENSGRIIKTEKVRLETQRSQETVVVRAAFDLLEGSKTSQSSFEGKWNIKKQNGIGEFRLGKVSWPLLAEWIPAGNWVSWSDSEVSGSLSFNVDQYLLPDSISMKLNFAPGNILLPGLGKQKFEGARLEGSWNSKEDRFEIQRLRGSMKNGLRANGSGYLDNPVGSPEGSFFIEVYPLALGSWISDSAKDVSEGLKISLRGSKGEKRFGKLETRVDLIPSQQKAALPGLKNVSGKISFENVSVEFENKSFPDFKGGFKQAHGELKFEMNSKLKIKQMRSQLDLREGSLLLGESGLSTPLRNLEFSSTWNGSELSTDDFVLEFDNLSRIEAQAALKWDGTHFQTIELQAKSYKVAVDSLSRVWHPSLASETRQWLVDRLSGGQVEEGSLNLLLEQDPSKQMQLKSLESVLQVKNSNIQFYKNLPPGNEVDAIVKIIPDQVEIKLSRGRVGQLQLNHGKLLFAPLRTGSPLASIDLKSSGPLAEALDLLEHPDLAVLKQEMLPFTESSGDVDLDLGMEFPLGTKVDGGFRFTAKAKVKEVRLSGMPLDLEMRNGTVEVDADSENVRVSGTGELSGAEVEFDFRKKGKNPSRTKVIAPLSEEMADLLGHLSNLDVRGQASADLLIAESADSQNRIALQLGLDQADISIPWIDLKKPPGEAAVLRGWANISQGTIESIPFIEIDNQKVRLKSRVILDEEGAFREIEITDFLAPGTNVDQIRISNEEDGSLKMMLEGSKLNLEPLIASNSGATPQTGKVSFELNSEAMKLNPSISLSGTLKGTLEDNGTFYAEHRGALFRDNQTLLNDANFTVLHSGNIPEVQGNGMIGENPLNFRFGSDTNGNGKLDLEAENAGEVFRFLDLTEAISGGRLELISNFQGDNLSIHDSEIRLSNFTLKEAPLLVDVFSLISPTGLLEQLLGDGVFYDEGYGKVSVSGNRYTIHEASAVGFSSGIVFSGWIDLDKNELDIKGSVAPAYILSRLVRWIPILGTILTGTDKGGLIALDFRLQGSIDKPEKSTNPLSLAPGILRDVFRFEWLNFFRGDNSTKQVEQPSLNLNESSE